MFFSGDKVPERRRTSVTYVELACLADILTGGAVGPRRGTFAEKAAIMKEGIQRLTKKANVTCTTSDDIVSADRFFCHLPTVCSASPVGFPALPGISRRPLIGKFPGVHAALGAMLNYAKMDDQVLDAVMPRYIWIKPAWREDPLLKTWEQLMAIRAGEEPRPDRLITNLQPFQILPQESKKPNKQEAAQTSEQAQQQQQQQQQQPPPPQQQQQEVKRRRTALQGPCVFGCEATTERSRGKQVWRRVPTPSPWASMKGGETICRKCYYRAMVILRKKRHDLQEGAEINEQAGRSDDVHLAGSPRVVLAETCSAIQGGAPAAKQNERQPCTSDSRGVHANSRTCFLTNPSKRRRIGQNLGEDKVSSCSVSFSSRTDSFLNKECTADKDLSGGHESQSLLCLGQSVSRSASFEDPECTEAKRARCESQRLPSGACSSSEPSNPELASGCKEIARQAVGLDGRPQGAIELGDGGLRLPEPLRPVAVHAPVSPVCPGLAMGRRVPPAMQPQMVGVHEAEPTGEGKA